MNYEEIKKRETLRKDEVRNMLCTKHRDVLKIIYFVGDRLISAPILIDFLCLTDSQMNFSKAQKLISKLVEKDVLQQEYISLSYNPVRTRILYLSKYATAHLTGLPNTIGADVLNRKHLSPTKIEKRVLRATMIYDRFKMFLTEHSIDDLLELWSRHASSYAYKHNQYRAYFLGIVEVFKSMPLEYLNRTAINEYGRYLLQAEILKNKALEFGQKSKNNKDGTLDVTLQKGVKFPRKYEWHEDASLPKVLTNMDIAGVVWDGERLTIEVDYLVTEDKAEYKKIVKNLSVIYKLFSLFVRESLLNFEVKLVFANELQLSKFNSAANKKNNKGESRVDIDLSKNGVMLTDALNISIRRVGEAA